ncbi:unnamed protein product [Fraxinus pennsylvanica]|uniref:Autophagy-related protein n=1 Tax=Fraxinus pennsylvanica TaxID=56036 RepID=A0AAD1YPW9_9LAMI|nr:unnamed protein product [Fraxinus pennsylvanica]
MRDLLSLESALFAQYEKHCNNLKNFLTVQSQQQIFNSTTPFFFFWRERTLSLAMANSSFKIQNPLEKRKAESTRIREKYPDRIPVVVEKAGRSDVPDIDKKKYLVPADLCIGQFVYVVRKRIKLSAEKAIFVFVDNILPPSGRERTLSLAMANSSFKIQNPLEKRKAESTRIREKYPDRIPVVVEKAGRSDVPDIDKKKYLVPADLCIGQFVYVVRKQIKLSAEKAIFVFVDNILPPSASLMSKIYEDYKDEDGFLYMTYSGENTFGSSEIH